MVDIIDDAIIHAILYFFPNSQARHDPYRLLRYDIAIAARDTDHSQPLLLTRHNAVPGMFLVRTFFIIMHFLFAILCLQVTLSSPYWWYFTRKDFSLRQYTFLDHQHGRHVLVF